MPKKIINLQQNGDIQARFNALDKEVRNWAMLTKKQLIFTLLQMGINERSELLRGHSRIVKARGKGAKGFDRQQPLAESIVETLRKRNGDIEAVAFSFARHGIFLEHGVGKHRPINSPAARYAAKPWLKEVLPDAIEALATALEEEYADIVAASLRLRINGIIDITTQR